MIALPWSVVTALRLEPVGPIDPMVFGLKFEREGWDDVLDITWEGTRYIECADYRGAYFIVDLPRARQTRDLLGSMMYDPRPIQGPFKPEKHPWYIAFCNLHSEVSR